MVTTHTAINLSLGRLFPERCEMRPLWSSVGTEPPGSLPFTQITLATEKQGTCLSQSPGKTRLISCSINTRKTSGRQLFHCLHATGPHLPPHCFFSVASVNFQFHPNWEVGESVSHTGGLQREWGEGGALLCCSHSSNNLKQRVISTPPEATSE